MGEICYKHLEEPRVDESCYIPILRCT